MSQLQASIGSYFHLPFPAEATVWRARANFTGGASSSGRTQSFSCRDWSKADLTRRQAWSLMTCGPQGPGRGNGHPLNSHPVRPQVLSRSLLPLS